MSQVNIDQLLHQMRQMAATADRKPAPQAPGAGEENGFGSILEASIEKVNGLQQNANALATAFEQGDPQVDLSQVMVELQKASVSFTAMVEVRNKLLSAYQDVMNMQV